MSPSPRIGTVRPNVRVFEPLLFLNLVSLGAVMEEETGRLVPVALTIAVVAGGIGYFVGESRGESRARETTQARADSREALMVDAINEKDRAMAACRQVIHRATRVIRGRTLYIENLYDGSLDDIRTAYQLGVEGNEEELAGG